MNRNRAVQGILRLTRALEATGARPWIQDGTLLGLVRNGDLIRWDHDCDFGMHISDYNQQRIHALINAGFQPGRTFGTLDNGFQQHWNWNGEKFDIFWHYLDGDTQWHAAYQKGQQYRYRYEQFNVKPARFLDGHVWIPSDPEWFLFTKYGEGWRTPRKAWDYARGPSNVELPPPVVEEAKVVPVENVTSRAVVLMPTGGDCLVRADNQAFVIKHYSEKYEIPVVLGRGELPDGRFSRATAVNRAYRIAKVKYPDRDVLVIADNDLLPTRTNFFKALTQVDGHVAITPFSHTRYLSEEGRLAVMRGEEHAEGEVREIGSRSFVVMRRDTFERVNGMDQLFIGWGPEDRAFVQSVKRQVGSVYELQGERVHLWHPVDASRSDAENVARLRARCGQYERASMAQAHALAREYGNLQDDS